MGGFARLVAAITLATFSIAGSGAEFIRWTFHEQTNAHLPSVIAELNRRTGFNFTTNDFRLVEDRDLAFSHYTRWLQIKQDVPVDKASLRIWRTAKNQLLQAEAYVENPDQKVSVASIKAAFTKEASLRVKRTIASQMHGLKSVNDLKQTRAWENERLVEIVKINTNRGVEKITIDAVTGRLLAKTFKPHPSHDAPKEFSVLTRAYPIYEEYNGVMLKTVAAELKYLNTMVKLPKSDPYAPLRLQHFYFKKHDAIKAATPEGRTEGYWYFPWLVSTIELLSQAIPPINNSLAAGGLFLDGRYATVSIHPLAENAFGPFSFQPQMGEHVLYDWREDESVDDWEIVPLATPRGKPWTSLVSLQEPEIVRDPHHDAKEYIENGFDQIQVYYSITKMFDALRPLGFADPELSERPFHAFLYFPDLEWKDNAFYTNDTINFTTYSSDTLNMARDNTTIWHELGHGVMERLMGLELVLADTGGLSEGMADFVAQLVIEATTNGAPFLGSDDQRIINNTGFFLTNEVHDDGEAYGGVMKQILDDAIAAWGRAGVAKVTDLILEAMRLTRDHPHLTADDWFLHVCFADEIGRKNVRKPFELQSIINNALISRNFGTEDERVKFSLRYQGQEVDAGSPGSRDYEIPVSIAQGETAEYPLEMDITDGTSTALNYPITVKVVFGGGPLQGAIDWVGEDNGPQIIELDGPASGVLLPLAINGSCDVVNRADGSCSDFAYVQIFEHGATKPIAKKRFYLKLKTNALTRSARLGMI